MCSKNIFGGSKTKQPDPPAVAQAAPVGVNEAQSLMNQGETNTQARGKRKLTIQTASGVGTGVNL